MRFGLIFSLIIAVIAVIFALQNPQMMDVNLLFFETQGSAALILIITFGLGVVVGLISTLPSRLRTRRKLKKLEKEKGAKSKTSSSVSPQKSSSGTSPSERPADPSDQ